MARFIYAGLVACNLTGVILGIALAIVAGGAAGTSERIVLGWLSLVCNLGALFLALAAFAMWARPSDHGGGTGAFMRQPAFTLTLTSSDEEDEEHEHRDTMAYPHEL